MSSVKVADRRRLLVERIAANAVINKSARLRDMLVYLCDRVIDDEVDQIHEQEVGHYVFGRPRDYDTSADNIVRVHASLLRKRLAEYFSKDGAQEPVVIEIPKGNYALLFRERSVSETPPIPASAGRTWVTRTSVTWILGAAAALFCASTIFLLLKEQKAGAPAISSSTPGPTVKLLWSQVFRANRPTDIVLDDATIGLYQDLAKHPIALDDYYNRSYLRKLPETAEAANLDRDAAASVIIRRYSSYAAVTLLWKIFEISQFEHGKPSVQFARDYSFHGLKTNDAVLLGSSQSNPWIEPFENRIGIRWVYDKVLESSYPVDTFAGEPDRSKFRPAPQAGDPREGYCAVSLLPNLGGSGNVLLISATGGSAMASCGDFLSEEQTVSALHRRLDGGSIHVFSYFEVLLRMKGRGSSPRDTSILLCRPPRT